MGALLLISRPQHRGIGRRHQPWRIANPPHRLRAPLQLQLVENVVDVMLDGRQADHKFARDFLVREAASDQLQDVTLAPGQRAIRIDLVGHRINSEQGMQQAA